MKYLKLLVDPDLGDSHHITFLYFGPYQVSPDKLSEFLHGIKIFSLDYKGPDLFGPNRDIKVETYTPDSLEASDRRKQIIDACLPRDLNLGYEWAPHITNTENPPKKIRVLGVVADDGSFTFEFKE